MGPETVRELEEESMRLYDVPAICAVIGIVEGMRFPLNCE